MPDPGVDPLTESPGETAPMDSDATIQSRTERAIEALRMTALPAEAMGVDQVTVLTVQLRLVLNELDRLRADDAPESSAAPHEGPPPTVHFDPGWLEH
jgi:hypothetical protein